MSSPVWASDIGAALVSHPGRGQDHVHGIEASGQRIAATAAADLKRVTLELGGKSPQIVFDDARLDDAVNGVISGIFLSLVNPASRARGSCCKTDSTIASSSG
jgi:acyl-CoA reductase-like NAD-dependent aldehyde dehydrogenase